LRSATPTKSDDNEACQEIDKPEFELGTCFSHRAFYDKHM
jgi:hypothetical protein